MSPFRYSVACLSGAAAESRFTGETLAALFATSARTDRQIALEAHTGNGSFEAALHDAEQLVAAHWRDIGKLAGVFMHTETLGESDLKRVLRQ